MATAAEQIFQSIFSGIDIMRYRLLAILIALFAFTSCAKDIVVLTGDIKGVVKDKDTGALISNCSVSITPGGDTLITGSSGSWGFAGLNPGQYTLTFTKAGYNDASCIVTVVTGKTTERDILLQSKGPFALSETTYDFGDYTMTKTFTCFNNSDTDTSYEIGNLPRWLTCDKIGGVVEAGSTDTFNLTVSRDNLDEGEYNHNVIIKYSGRQSGDVTLRVEVKKVTPRAPQLEIAPAATGVGKDCFTIEASVTAMGGSQITAYGFCWGKSKSSMSKTNNLGVMSELDSFKGTITNLEYNTTYYVKAYATNATGTGYSDVVTVTTQDMGSDKWDGSMASSFAGGKGTSASPYLIETGAQLVLMKQHSDKYFKLTQNINLDNRAWPAFDFSGSLDGDGFTISNLKVTRSDDNVGLFGLLSGTVKDLTISGVDIDTNADNVGALAGYCDYSGKVMDCTVILNSSSSIEGGNSVGGVVGVVDNGTVTRCTVKGDATKSQIIGDKYVGGLVGQFYDHQTPIEDCYVSVNVAGTEDVGGLIGLSFRLTIKSCSFVGSLEAENYVAGVIGEDCGDSELYGCKAEVEISVSGQYAAGLMNSDSVFSKKIVGSYAVGEIACDSSSAEPVGGLLTSSSAINATIDSCYSMVICNSTNFNGIWGHYYNETDASWIANCASIMEERHSSTTNCTSEGNNFSEFLQGCFSDYADYWNFGKTWTWEGKVNGQSRKVTCPRLAWEN